MRSLHYSLLYVVSLCVAVLLLAADTSARADTGLDVIIGIITNTAKGDGEMSLMKYFAPDLIKAFNKASNSPNGGPDFPWWFPRPSYETFKTRTVIRSDTDVSLIIERDQGENKEESTIEYVLRETGGIWNIYDVKELPSRHDPPSTRVESLRGWLGLK
jgi:hypothetical protein